MSSAHRTGTLEAHGCSIDLRRVTGPVAAELFLHVRPPAEAAADAGRQAEALYHAILAALEAQGAGFGAVVSETVFLGDVGADLARVRDARRRVLDASDAGAQRPATTEIEQPPLDARARLEVSLQAVVPHAAPLARESLQAPPACPCPECVHTHALRVRLGGESRLYASAIYGAGEDATEQTLALFQHAEALLQQAGMAFGDVVRTWLHLREMDRDYAGLNRARRRFFESRGIDPAPASTGIGGGLAPDGHDICLAFYAVHSSRPPERSVMNTPTLNEAPLYGSDFARGMRVGEANKIALHVSGTASIDETGSTVHVDDVDAQADRTLVNVAALLEGQDASFADVVSAVTYLKRREDAERLRAKLREAGFDGFPNALVVAPVCRPELLCEIEALAVRPHGSGGSCAT